MNLINLPYNNLFEILLNTETTELINLCPVHPTINKICNDEHFWRLKLLQDYQLNTTPPHLSSKQYYMWLYIPKQIPVYESVTTFYNRAPVTNFLGIITIRRTETLQDLFIKSNQLIDDTKFVKRLQILDKNSNIIGGVINPLSNPDIRADRRIIGVMVWNSNLSDTLDDIDRIVYSVAQ